MAITRWLEPLSEEDRRQVLSDARYVRYRRGETIHREGDPPGAMHLLVKGHVALQLEGHIGERTTVGLLGPGDTLGLESLSSTGEHRMSTASVLDPVEAWKLPRDLVTGVVEEHPVLRATACDLLLHRLAGVTRWLADSRTRHAEERVVLRLSDLADNYAVEGEGSGRPRGVCVRLTQRELAEVAGTTRPTVSRALRHAEARGLVAISRGSIHVLDVDGLRALGA